MKILHICVTGPYTDGFDYQENLLTKYHVKDGYEVHIIASEWQWRQDGKIERCEEKQDYKNADGVIVHRLKIKGEKDVFFRYKRFECFYEKIEEIKPDIIFIHNLQFFDIDKIVKYAKKHQVKIYVDNHADFSNSARSKAAVLFYKIVWRHMAQMVEPYTAKFYGVLPARVDWLVNMYGLPKEKCELLVMGADDDKVLAVQNDGSRQEIRNKYNILQDDFLIMTGGKIDAWKTQTLLLMEAVKGIQNDKVRLIVFGSVTPELKEKVNALSDGVKVQYIGWVQSELSYKYWSAADLVVFPGRHSVFWEQVAGMGIPMLCKYWDGTTHVDLDGNVKFLKEDSVAEIKTKIEELLNCPEKYKQMKAVAVEKGMEIFSYKKISERAIRGMK